MVRVSDDDGQGQQKGERGTQPASSLTKVLEAMLAMERAACKGDPESETYRGSFYFSASLAALQRATGLAVPTIVYARHDLAASGYIECVGPGYFRILKRPEEVQRADVSLEAHPENIRSVSGMSPGDFKVLMARMMVDPAPVEPGTPSSRPPRPARRSTLAPPPQGFGLPRST